MLRHGLPGLGEPSHTSGLSEASYTSGLGEVGYSPGLGEVSAIPGAAWVELGGVGWRLLKMSFPGDEALAAWWPR